MNECGLGANVFSIYSRVFLSLYDLYTVSYCAICKVLGTGVRVLTKKCFVMSCVSGVVFMLILSSGQHIRVIYKPIYPHFCIVKQEFTGVYLFFLFLIQNIDC